MSDDGATRPGSKVIDVTGLRMRYGATDVLDGVDLHVDRGEVVVLLGPNGAGKTTTIEILEGFRLPSEGHVQVLGQDPARADEEWRAGVGVVLQSWRDHGRWKVRELLDHFGSFYRPYATADRHRPFPTAELLDRVGLTAQAEQQVKTLSGGQRRRLDVAIGIVGRPQLLFLDEPTAGFDPAVRRDFHELIHRLSDLEDTTILLTTHDLAEAEKLADRILILDRGRIVADGSADELARQVAGRTEVRWTAGGQRHVHATVDGTAFVRELFARQSEDIADLEVRRTTLEDTYLTMVARSKEPAGPDVVELEAAR
ncbi:ABC transporter ATP-binding protein [Georgenia sp. MJ170]|uniref:ABC transporter ATP-binding protein n=1 Tax=Georgenia sunbinii TaxID=3117728 RepID=UPI002F26BDF6